jgi:hypothetical protein
VAPCFLSTVVFVGWLFGVPAIPLVLAGTTSVLIGARLRHYLSASLEQDTQPPIPKTRLFSRQLHQAQSQPFVAPPDSVAITRYRHQRHARRSLKAYSSRTARQPPSGLRVPPVFSDHRLQRFDHAPLLTSEAAGGSRAAWVGHRAWLLRRGVPS